MKTDFVLIIGTSEWYECFEGPLSISEKIGRQDLIAFACRRLAEALLRQGKKAEGVPYARRAVDILTRLGSREIGVAEATLAEFES